MKLFSVHREKNPENWRLIFVFCCPVYQDDSSDDLTEAIDDLLIPASDAEDNWDLEDDKIDVDDDDEDEEDDDEDKDDEDSDVEEVYADESESDEDLVNGEPSNGNHKDIEMDSD